MDVEYYREFIELSRRLSFRETAKDLNLSQSALSKHIMLLENLYETRLFVRDKHQVYLTATGAVLLGQAEQIWGAYEDSLQAIGSYSTQKNLMVGGIIESPESYAFMSKVFSSLQQIDPSFSIRLITSSSISPRAQADRILGGDMDCSVVYGASQAMLGWDDASKFKTVHLFDMPLDIIVSADNALVKKRKLRYSDFSSCSFVHLAGPNYTPIWKLIEKLLKENQVSFRVNTIAVTSVYDYANLDLQNSILVIPRKMNPPALNKNPNFALMKTHEPSFCLGLEALFLNAESPSSLNNFISAMQDGFKDSFDIKQ